jgi:polysaccharide export outer membrane protein
MTGRFVRISSSILCVLALSACAGQPTTPPPAISAPEAASDYLLGPGDTLNVFVYRAPELSQSDLPVRPDGRISLPLVPDIDAAGLTPTRLARVIEGRLKEYVRDPNVTVMVRSFVGPSSRQVRVIGEAAQPMSMPSGNRAEIVRRTSPNGPAQVIPVRLADLLRDGDISQDIPMQPGDTLVIPQGWF